MGINNGFSHNAFLTKEFESGQHEWTLKVIWIDKKRMYEKNAIELKLVFLKLKCQITNLRNY